MRIVVLLAVAALIVLSGCSSGAYKIASTDSYGWGTMEVGPSNMIVLQVVDAIEGNYITRWQNDVDSGELEPYWAAEEGRRMGPIVRNVSNRNMVVFLDYEQPTDNYSTYLPAPDFFASWVSFPGNDTTIKPGEVWCLPYQIELGDISELPDRFWFGIRVSYETSSLVRDEYIVWWLIELVKG